MNQKDYKEIALSINNSREEFLQQDLSQGEQDLVYSVCKKISNKLADYFEEEDDKNQPTKDVWNREQFLKDCGVECSNPNHSEERGGCGKSENCSYDVK